MEVPAAVVEVLGAGKRPRVAIMRGRYLLGLSNANRGAP